MEIMNWTKNKLYCYNLGIVKTVLIRRKQK